MPAEVIIGDDQFNPESGKQIADKLAGEDTFKYIADPVRAQAQPAEEEWNAVTPPAKRPRKTPPVPRGSLRWGR